MSNEHTPEQPTASPSREDWYDAEIAPKLREIAQLCENRGMGFLSAVEYAPGERATTVIMPADHGLAMAMLKHCALMGENIDGYFIGLLRYAKEHDIDLSGSLVMKQIERESLGG